MTVWRCIGPGCAAEQPLVRMNECFFTQKIPHSNLLLDNSLRISYSTKND
jgi:hypothetical protein